MSFSLSPVQNHIVSRLKNAKSLRYSELALDRVPNDLFNYHLQFLVKKGLVSKSGNGYALSEEGVKYVADFNPTADNAGGAHLFKVNVLTVVSRFYNKKLEILNQVRKSNPSYGKVGVMGGVVRKGESIEVAACRKLRMETGLVANFKVVGMQRRMMYVKGELFSDIFFPIAYADEHEGELKEDTEYGHNMWVDVGMAIEHEKADFDSLISLQKVLTAVKDNSILKMPFFYEEDIQDDALE